MDLVTLKAGQVYEYDYHIGKEFFELKENDEILGCDVDVHLSVEKRHETYILEFDLAGDLEVPCDRCLDPVTLPVDEVYDIAVRHGEEYDDSSDDVLVIPEGWTRLDVSGLIYDTLMLTIPLRCVHAEGECNRDMQAALHEHNRESGEEASE